MPLKSKLALLASILCWQCTEAADSLLAPDAFETATFSTSVPDDATELPKRSEADAPDNVIRTVEINGRGMEFYAAQLIMPVVEPFAKGDTLYLTFDARTTAVRDESGEGLLTAFLQEAKPDWNKSLLRTVPLTDTWTTYRFPFRAAKSLSPTKVGAQLGFGFGGREQTVELANISLTNHGSAVKPADLPQTRATYAGREADAPWRAAAAQRIEQFRKAELQLIVVDANGEPIHDARVNVEQQRHAFYFGSAVAAKAINDQGADNDRYREITRTWFNHVVLESALKWEATSGEWDINGNGTTEDALVWLRDQDLHIKGHVLIWPSFRFMPKSIGKLKNDPVALRAAVEERIVDTATQYRAYLDEWDVINEPYANHEVMDILGDGSITEWFQLAKEASPDTPLYLNEYGILTGGDAYNTTQRQHYDDSIASLLAEGAPLEGLGMQSHFGEHLTPPAALYQVLNRYSRFGLPIQITEFDIDTSDEVLQADYTRDFMTLVFSHPQVNGFVMWGFWENRHWRPKAAMFRSNWEVKPNGQAFHDLVYQTWWTDVSGTTDADGGFATRAFLGDYQITVEHEGVELVKNVQLTQDSQYITLTLPD